MLLKGEIIYGFVERGAMFEWFSLFSKFPFSKEQKFLSLYPMQVEDKGSIIWYPGDEHGSVFGKNSLPYNE